MNRKSLKSAALIVSIYATSIIGHIHPARAMPPTVVPSPGYDARLAEQRRAMTQSSQPPVILKQPLPRRSLRRHRSVR